MPFLDLIGVVSYLLVNFWYTRGAANRAAMMALLTNRVGDWGYTIALFIVISIIGSVETGVIFSISEICENSYIVYITLGCLIGVMGKSAQLGLHTWLPWAMEGFLNYKIINKVMDPLALIVKSLLGALILLITTMLVEWAPLYNMALEINKCIYCTYLNIPILATLQRSTLETFTGNMLGDGSVRYANLKKNGVVSGNARYKMTMSAKAYDYINSLVTGVYSPYIKGGLQPYPNLALIQHKGKVVTQYHFDTVRDPVFSALHSLWYRWDSAQNKYYKIVPESIMSMFGEKALAH